jgi:hypothetical protein
MIQGRTDREYPIAGLTRMRSLYLLILRRKANRNSSTSSNVLPAMTSYNPQVVIRISKLYKSMGETNLLQSVNVRDLKEPSSNAAKGRSADRKRASRRMRRVDAKVFWGEGQITV